MEFARQRVAFPALLPTLILAGDQARPKHGFAGHVGLSGEAPAEPIGRVRLLMIRTKIVTSPIHGVGCFACDASAKGAIVWQFHPQIDLVFTRTQILAMPQAFQIFLVQYASKDLSQDRYVYCSDNSRFINHAVGPNLVHNADTSATTMFASRDIAAGEELTLDYRFVDDPDEAGNVLTEIGLAFGERDYLDPRIKDRPLEALIIQTSR